MDKHRVLIIEDEFLIALDLQQKLHRSCFEVCGTAAEGEEAVEIARTTDPDAILMDINLMGPIDGIEAARQIGEFSSAIIIFTTGYQDPGLRERAMALKPAAYLIKPINIIEIDTIITSALAQEEHS
jgi:DNA-binding NarL/FixJ family response regulator